jgi:outer membrane protein TolC
LLINKVIHRKSTLELGSKALQHLKNLSLFFLLGVLTLTLGCSSAGKYRQDADKTAYKIIENAQKKALGRTEPFTIEPPEITLRKRLMIDQDLQYSHPSSLGTKELEEIEHWPEDDYLVAKETLNHATYPKLPETLEISLIDALQIAAKHSRQYQSQKENVFRAALQLDLAQDEFRSTFTGALEGMFDADLRGEDYIGVEGGAVAGWSKQFMNGVSLSTRIGLDVARLFDPFSDSSSAIWGDASISIPLLRGSGRHIVAEPLKQAERDTIYAIYEFERYKREFTVNIINQYFRVLQTIDNIENQKGNYEGLVRSTRRAKRLRDAGQLDPIQVDQSIQQELSARQSWISSQISYQSSIDSFKLQLGLPPDAEIELDRNELERLRNQAQNFLDRMGIETEVSEEEIPPADADVILEPISMDKAGPFELDENLVIQLAFENRLDLRVIQGNVYDAQRAVVVSADALRPELTLLGSASVGEGRSLGSVTDSDSWNFGLSKSRYNAILTLDLPFERTREMINYRNSIINLERTVRDLQEFEDSIKLDLRDTLRDLLQTREELVIEVLAVTLAQKRVTSTELYIQAGRKEIRDYLEAQESLLRAQTSLTRALIDYRIAELSIQRDMGLLEVNHEGLWTEFDPEALKQ